MNYLLDTHVLLHYGAKSPKLSQKHEEIILAASAQEPLYLSDISLWEIATLHSLNRINIPDLATWLEQVCSPPLINRVRISPAIAAEVAKLPDGFHHDPGDRIIVATAISLGLTLLTQDERIISTNVVKTL